MGMVAGLRRLALLFLVCVLATPVGAADAPPATAEATPCVRVTTINPREINLGKPATFQFHVTNDGKTPATGVVLATRIPGHVKLTAADPQALDVEGELHRFQIGDVAPGTTRRVTLVVVPQSVEPFHLDSTVIFAASTRSSVVVRRPLLNLSAQVTPQVLVGQEANWTLRVTNSGDGPADDVTVTRSLLAGDVRGSADKQSVRVGPLKPGETKEVQFTVVPNQRGEVKARFVGVSPEGLEATHEAAFQAVQAELAVTVLGPAVQPLGRSATYEIRVTNPGDAAAGQTFVTAKVPAGLEVTGTTEKNAYTAATRTLRWRITGIRPIDAVPLRFEAETRQEGHHPLEVSVTSEGLTSATAAHSTTVIGRPNPVVTVINDQELAKVGESIGFKVIIVNAGSKQAEDLRVRVALPQGLEAIESADYQVTEGEINFPPHRLASGEKVTLAFRALGRHDGEHRVQVLVQSLALTRELTYETSAFCYSDTELQGPRAAQGGFAPGRAAAGVR